MNENSLTGTQIAVVFGVVCAATAVTVGLGLRALRKKNETVPPFGSDLNLKDLSN